MKIYKSTNNTIHLRDLIDRIDYFYVVDNVAGYNYGEITASENPDEEFYSTISDEDLAEILESTDSDTSTITNIYILDRIAKINKYKLTGRQKYLLSREYKRHITIDDTDREYLLELFKQCNHIHVADRPKNTRFTDEYGLSDEDILSILHNLTLSDFRYKARSTNFNYFGNNIVILKPKIVIPGEDRMIAVNLYIKIDLDYEDRSCIAFISFHPEYQFRRH